MAGWFVLLAGPLSVASFNFGLFTIIKQHGGPDIQEQGPCYTLHMAPFMGAEVPGHWAGLGHNTNTDIKVWETEEATLIVREASSFLFLWCT